MGSSNFLKVIVQNFDVLVGPLVALAYPLYASIRAIESKSRTDDKQWLTYWVLYSLITLFELTFAKVIEWFPIWPYAKLIATCWLVLPRFNGAAYVYEHFIRPYYVNAQPVNIWYIPRKKNIFNKPDDILTAAEKYIEENGSEAFEKLISKLDMVLGGYMVQSFENSIIANWITQLYWTNRESRSRRSRSYMISEGAAGYNSKHSNYMTSEGAAGYNSKHSNYMTSEGATDYNSYDSFDIFDQPVHQYYT